MARIDAGTDLHGPLFDGLLDQLEMPIGLVFGTVVVDRDLDAVLLGEGRQGFEAVGRRIRGIDRKSHSLGKLERFFGVVDVPGEALNAPGEDLDPRSLHLLLGLVDFGFVIGDGQLLAEELSVLQSEVLEVTESLVEVEIAQGVGLKAHLEAAIGILGVEAEGKGTGRGPGGGAPEKTASGHAHQFSLLLTDRRARSGRGSNLKDIRSIPEQQAIKQNDGANSGLPAKDSDESGRINSQERIQDAFQGGPKPRAGSQDL